AEGVVVAGRGQGTAVGGEGDRADVVVVAAQDAYGAGRRQVPDVDVALVRAPGEAPAVGADGEAAEPVRRVGFDFAAVLAGVRAPEAQPPVVAAGKQRRAVRRKRQVVDAAAGVRLFQPPQRLQRAPVQEVDGRAQ